MRIQKRIHGGRDPLPSCVLPMIRNKVSSLAAQYNCSKSFVIATILAEALNIPIGEKYNDYDKRTRDGRRKKSA